MRSFWEDEFLRVFHTGTSARPGISLLAMCRNEMFFLPRFIEHYRSLGVTRFCIIDDSSDDGSFEFLSEQPDVVLISSPYSYGDTFTFQEGPFPGREIRAMLLWRNMLAWKFGVGNWALQMDADEFIQLPDGEDLFGVAERLMRKNARLAMGVMLDVYPRNPERMQDAEPDLSGEWFFDGERHLELREGKRPKQIYAGARARLMFRAKVKYVDWRKRWKSIRRREVYPHHNVLYKPTLVKWHERDLLYNSHEVSVGYDCNTLLPILHFKFTADTNRKIKQAIREGSYYKNSSEYRFLGEMLARMESKGMDFCYEKSMPAGSFSALLASGNARFS